MWYECLLSVWSLIGLMQPAQMEPARPSPRYILVRVTTQPGQIQELVDAGLDVWDPEPDGQSVEIRVSQAELSMLRDRGFEPVTLDPDLYATIERTPVQVVEGQWSQYHDLTSANEFMADLADAHPDRAALFTIGHTVEGRPINGIRISDDATTVDHGEPAFFIVGCHHAREWISVEVPLYIAQQLLEGCESDPALRSIVDRGEVWIVPILNVDGYLYTQTTDRLWRLNRSLNDGENPGVDLNRNYSFQWGRSVGSSGVVGSENYRGPFAFSEPETRAVNHLFASRRFMGALSYHSYGQLVLSPWGYTTANPIDSPAMESLGVQITEIINENHEDPNLDYYSGRWGPTLYIGSGIFEDWVYGMHRIVGILVELRPRGSPFFLLPPEQILPTCEESFPAAIHMIETVFGPAGGAFGDFDGNHFVMPDDLAILTRCLAGPDRHMPGFPLGCPATDMSTDGHVDLRDAALFMGGPIQADARSSR